MKCTLVTRGWYRCALCLGPLLLPMVVGCGPGTGTVSGEVTYKGKPLRAGYVRFVPADPKRNAVTTTLDENGHYEATVPVGEVKIAVDNSEWKPAPKGPGGLPPGLNIKLPAEAGKLDVPAKGGEKAQGDSQRRSDLYRDIPPKYYRVEDSGLTYTVVSGTQKHPIELK